MFLPTHTYFIISSFLRYRTLSVHCASFSRSGRPVRHTKSTPFPLLLITLFFFNVFHFLPSLLLFKKKPPRPLFHLWSFIFSPVGEYQTCHAPFSAFFRLTFVFSRPSTVLFPFLCVTPAVVATRNSPFLVWQHLCASGRWVRDGSCDEGKERGRDRWRGERKCGRTKVECSMGKEKGGKEIN